MNVLSLFSGIGGLELGLELAGMRVVGQVEIHPFCRRVLEKHWPEVPRHDDVRTCVEWWGSEPRPAVDLVCGGFPCQGHSVAGLRRGTGDERWGWPWYRSVVEAVKPPWVLIENVPNLVRTGLVDVLADLADLGFDAWWGRVPAAAVGAPHLRWRLFVIAAHPGRVQLRDEPGWCRGPDREGPSVIGHDGTAWALADANGKHGHDGRHGAGEIRGQRPSPSQLRRGENVADANGTRLEGRGLRGTTTERRPDAPVANPVGVGGDQGSGLRQSQAGRGGPSGLDGTEPANGDWWAAEPDVGRVAHGVPARMDRLRALGNAVVPAVGKYVGGLIMAADRVNAPLHEEADRGQH